MEVATQVPNPMTDQYTIELIKLAPNIGALIWIVYAFVKHIDTVNIRHEKQLLDLSERMNKIVDNNTMALGRALHTLDKHGDKA